jgi:energy-coupling factor transporter ATP-binding protein EcfA2
MPEIIAQFDRVSYLYPQSKEPVLRDITLDVYRGEFLGVIGPTGAGKTTLCLCLNGIIPQFFGGRFFGKVTAAGYDTLEHPISTLAGHVGQVFEDPESQLITTSVENEIAFALENLSVPREEMRRRIAWSLDAVRLTGLEKKNPFELSSGQKQRLAIAAALAINPDLLVLDEPTSQLDPVGVKEVFSTVHELNKKFGMTIFMAGHAVEEMAEFADRIALISAGRLVTLGSPADVLSRVEELEALSLRPPQVAATFFLIQRRKIPVPAIPVSLKNGLSALNNLKGHALLTPPTIREETPLPQPGPPLISVNNLHYIYPDGTEALRGVSLDIFKGDFILLAGQNGAGKSSLVRHFVNLLHPTSGTVKIEGREAQTFSVSTLARRIGFVAQNPDHQIFNTTVEEEVGFALKKLGVKTEEVEERTITNLRAMGLLDLRHSHPLSLPRGHRARLVIAAVLAMQPEIIIFDEPTTGQDFSGAHQILEITRQLHAEGKTILVITHHLYLMPGYARRVIIMGKGTILLDAPIRKAYHNVDLLNKTFLSPPQVVFLAQEMSRMENASFPLLTPQELADCFNPNPNNWNTGLSSKSKYPDHSHHVSDMDGFN